MGLLQRRPTGKLMEGLMETILLIETDPATLVALSLILHSFGYSVLEGSSRSEAWRVCRDHQGPIHLILMEAHLDDDGAIEFVTRFQLLHPQVCALLLSDESSEFSENQHVPCEYALLQRPFRANALAEAIKGMLDGAKTTAVSSLA
jgi:two-component system cell cycle sensor histidine kinase/response regulator CckA